MRISAHAQQRMSQRALSKNDLNLVMRYGTETKDGYYLRQRDVEHQEKELRKIISQLHRLSGKYVVADGDTVITAYHPSKPRQKRILRHQILN